MPTVPRGPSLLQSLATAASGESCLEGLIRMQRCLPSLPPKPRNARCPPTAGLGWGQNVHMRHHAFDEVCTSPLTPGRQGYLFREGSWGSGYYRKDVVRRYCPSAAQPVPGTAAAAPAPAGAGSSTGAGQQRQQQEEAGRAGPQPDPEGEQARQYIQRLLAMPPSMHSVALGPCGSLLFTSSLGPKDHAVRVWRLLPGGSSITDASTGGRAGCVPQPELYRTLSGHTAPVLALALTPDGSLLLSGSYDRTIRVWRTADWHCLRVLKGHGGGVRALAVAPDARTLYSAAGDNTLRVRQAGGWAVLGGSWCGRAV